MKTLTHRTNSVVGLDIGSYSVKLVHLSHGENGCQLLSSEEKEYFVPDGVDQKRIIEATKEVFHQAGLKPGRENEVVTSVSGSGTAIKQVEFPLLTDEELASSIKWEVNKHLPFGLEEAILDYQVLSRDKASGSMTVLLAAVTRAHLAEHLELLGKIGIDPPVIDLSPLAVMNALQASQDLMKNRVVVVLDLGARNTVLNIFCPGGPFFTREISTSGHQMTAEIQKQLDVTYDEAERIKREGDPSQLSDILKDPLNQLVFGIRRSLTYYENRMGEGGFHKLYLAGGGSRLVNLVGHLHSKLEVSVEELNPLKGIQVNGNQEALSTVAPQLTLAVGLALRKVGRISV